MREVPPKGLKQRIKDKLLKGTRVSFVAHCSRYPKIGDSVAWTRSVGGYVIAPIIEVEPFFDPRDMFTLQVYITPNCRAQQPTQPAKGE